MSLPGVRCLEGIDAGLAVWTASTLGSLFSSYNEPFYIVALSVTDDEQTDLTRIREQSGTNRESFPSAVIVRQDFKRYTHTRSTTSLYKVYQVPAEIANATEYKYMAIEIKYKWKLYCVNYTQACIFTERLAINWMPQYSFPYNVGDSYLDGKLHAACSLEYPKSITKASNREERNSTGPIHVVELPITVHALLFDIPQPAHLVQTIDVKVLDYNNKLLSEFYVPGTE